ncbi:MAG: Ig-like domain-containing protein [Mobilitalea sp.]
MSKGKGKDNRPFVFQIYKLFVIAFASILILHFLYQNSSLFYLKLPDMPFSLHLNKEDVYLIKGEEFKLTVFGINKRVSFKSTNFRVAAVLFTGKIIALQPGKTYIIAKVDNKELKCRVHVLDLNKKVIKLRVGDSYGLDVKGVTAFVNWKSKNREIASVNYFGKVTAKAKGNTVIYAKVKGKTLRCTVTVK